MENAGDKEVSPPVVQGCGQYQYAELNAARASGCQHRRHTHAAHTPLNVRVLAAFKKAIVRVHASSESRACSMRSWNTDSHAYSFTALMPCMTCTTIFTAATGRLMCTIEHTWLPSLTLPMQMRDATAARKPHVPSLAGMAYYGLAWLTGLHRQAGLGACLRDKLDAGIAAVQHAGLLARQAQVDARGHRQQAHQQQQRCRHRLPPQQPHQQQQHKADLPPHMHA